MDSVLRILLFAYCLVLLCRQGGVRANAIYMAKDVEITMITLNCTVNTLFSGIDFTYPNKNYGHAYCIVPGILGDTQCNCTCNFTLTSKCNITQDIPTKTTTLQIVDTNLTGMFGWYTCTHGSYKKSTMVTRPTLWLEQEVNDALIKLSCTPDKLKSRMDFYFPNISLGHAYCGAPKPEFSYDQCNCSCNATSVCKCSIIQDIATKTTTLIIQDKDLTSLVGFYTCVHGSTNKSTMVATPNTSIQDYGDYRKNIEIATIVVPTMSVTAVIVISIFLCVFPDIPGRIKKNVSRCFHGEPIEEEHILFEKKCSVCQQLCICAICKDCKLGFCDPCCEKHLKFEENLSHIVFQIQHVATSQEKIQCGIKKCKQLAERVCTNCWKQLCMSCVSTAHDEKCTEYEMILIYQTPSDSPRQQTRFEQDKLKHLRTIQIQKDKYTVRICGIDFLEDGTLVAIDKNNNKIILVTTDFKQFLKLENEPHAMTAMTGSEIAVTFPCIKQIKIYTIYWDLKNDNAKHAKYEIRKVIKMRDLGMDILKPFSIAFNKNVFAVEVGEGEDGKIVIIDNNNNKTYDFADTNQWKFAYFTGHTIRLALAIERKDMDNKPQGRLYMSTMSNKMVSCIDLEGKKLWEVSMSSPRSIIIVPKKHPFGDSIILSSRRFNAIYELGKEKGKDKILQASGIESPRNIACHFNKNTFCVLVKNKEQEDELAIFKFKNIEKQDDADEDLEVNESTNLV